MIVHILKNDLQFIIFSFGTPDVWTVAFFVKTYAYYIEFSYIVDIYLSEENLVLFMVMIDFRCYRSCFIYIDLPLSVTQRAIISDFANLVPALCYVKI